MYTAGNVILLLKIAVVLVTILLLASLFALWRGAPRWHGRINIAVFVLTMAALIGLELIARLIEPAMFDRHFTENQAWGALYTHLAFSVPAALLLPVMLFTGLRRRIWFHYRLAWVFLFFWLGTLITGVFLLPN